MNVSQRLQQQFGTMIALEETAPNISRVYAPFFHEDGDMISMYIDTSNTEEIVIRDFGNTLMRVSYTFDFDTTNKKTILNNIVKSNYGELDDGELKISSSLDALSQAVFQYSQLVAKVSSIDLLQRQVIKSLFFEYLNEFIVNNFSQYGVRHSITPTRDKELVVDYEIPAKKPLYIFGVNENTKASKVVISCLNFQRQKLPFRSLIVHEDFDGLSTFYRNQITNASDKQFTSLDEFRLEGADYIIREIA